MDWLEKFEIQFQLLSSLVRMICDQKASGDRDIKSLGVDLLRTAALLNLSIQLEGKALRFAVLLFESVHLSCDLLEIADKANPNSFWNILVARTDPDHLRLEIHWIHKLNVEIDFLTSLVLQIRSQEATRNRNIKGSRTDFFLTALTFQQDIQLEGKRSADSHQRICGLKYGAMISFLTTYTRIAKTPVSE